jgi:hypothetical protein
MNTRYLGTLLKPWLAAALSAAFLAGCDAWPDETVNGKPRALEERPQGRLEALRVQSDTARNRLWVLHRDAVYVYAITTRRQIGRIVLPDWMYVGEPFNCAPDLALDPSGAAIVSSNVRASLWRLDPERFAVTRHDLELDTDRDKDVGFTGLAFADGALFGIDAVHGSLWKIDLATAKAEKIELSAPVRGACGLARHPSPGPDRSLVLCAVGGKRSHRITLSPDLRRGNVTGQSCPWIYAVTSSSGCGPGCARDPTRAGRPLD